MKKHGKVFPALFFVLSRSLTLSSAPATFFTSPTSAFAIHPTSRSYRSSNAITEMSGSSSGWASTWKDILSGGNGRWKITAKESHEKAYAKFQKFVLNGRDIDTEDENSIKNISVFCPLAGDDPFVHLLYQKGYNITAIDLVAEAIESMKTQFGDESSWTKDDESSSGDEIVWKHNSGRVTLIVGDALKKRPNLNKSFDAVYDKDSFGALPKQMREPFCQRISEYTKGDAIVYLECKLKKGVVGADNSGPPYSLRREDLMEDDCYGSKFEYVEGLGSVYDLPGNMNAVMQQTGHIIRRTASPATL